jgi:hypothetical protein
LPEAECRAATAMPAEIGPCARCVLVPLKAVPPAQSPLAPRWEGPELRFGQRLLVAAAGAGAAAAAAAAAGGGSGLGGEPLYLASRPATALCAARGGGGRQLVFFAASPGRDAAWAAQPPDPAARGAAEGRAVAAGEPLVLVHCATGAPLCLEDGAFAVPTDFGPEPEARGGKHSGLTGGNGCGGAGGAGCASAHPRNRDALRAPRTGGKARSHRRPATRRARAPAVAPPPSPSRLWRASWRAPGCTLAWRQPRG